MAQLDPLILAKLHSLGTKEEEFIYDEDILEVIRFLMGYLHTRPKENCHQVQPIYNTLLEALKVAQANDYDVQLPPPMVC